jgi:hypothetical protein
VAVHNARFWKRRFEQDFIPSTRLVAEVFLDRLMPTFSAVEAEAEAFADKLWKDAMEQPYYEGCPDESEIAEAVEEASVERYLSLKGIEQGLINSAAVFLYQLFEQHLMLFHRKELLKIQEQDDAKLLTQKEIENRLSSVGVIQKHFNSWPKIEVLQCLANTVKHGEGRSSQLLASRVPGLFKSPFLDNQTDHAFDLHGRVYLPLLGEDIYVRSEDIKAYADAIEMYWMELAAALEQANSP